MYVVYVSVYVYVYILNICEGQDPRNLKAGLLKKIANYD